MNRPLSPIHAPLDPYGEHPGDRDPTYVPRGLAVVTSRLAQLAVLDQRPLAGRQHSLGPGGASAAFSRAVDKALVDEMAEQLRGRPRGTGELATWAADIIAVFEGD